MPPEPQPPSGPLGGRWRIIPDSKGCDVSCAAENPEGVRLSQVLSTGEQKGSLAQATGTVTQVLAREPTPSAVWGPWLRDAAQDLVMEPWEALS